MPKGPLPPALVEFVETARPAVIGTVRPNGTPTTTPTWYEWHDGHVLLSMVTGGPREQNVRANPSVALTILGEDWYDHVSLRGPVVEIRPDEGLADLDRLSQRYWGEPYPKRELVCVSVIVEVQRWHAWGTPRENAIASDPGSAERGD
jgi:PPOX class probable F420-dependent enzyme